ncbi:MAG: putative amino acid transporter, partial [Bacteroidota bacterium]|nr:putative amino acid transporter [Bacteroidota bacterium]
SFPDANIIIYTPKSEKSMALAQRFDSLFLQYNATNEHKYTLSMLNSADQMVNGKKTSLDELLQSGKTNILIITSYDEPYVQSTLRSVYEKGLKLNIVVYGLPTWLSGDILRLDYINNLHTRISDAFFADTSKPKTKEFIERYTTNFFVEPTKYSYLGYDVSNFLLRSVATYGKDFLPQLSTQRYSGTGYKFDIAPTMKNATTINYYENNHVNVLKVQDFSLKKVW